MNKKGAIEFSMTTIMIIIIGVAVLALGLAWIRGAFRQIGDITEIAFEEAKQQLSGELGPDNPIVVSPGGLSLGANDQKTIHIGCYNNDQSNTPQLAELTITPTPTNVVIQKSDDSNPNKIQPGEEFFWGLVVKAKSVSSSTNPEVVNLDINCNGGTPERKPLTITYK